eukprot:615776-Hanusia_phi.AAC.1
MVAEGLLPGRPLSPPMTVPPLVVVCRRLTLIRVGSVGARRDAPVRVRYVTGDPRYPHRTREPLSPGPAPRHCRGFKFSALAPGFFISESGAGNSGTIGEVLKFITFSQVIGLTGESSSEVIKASSTLCQ